MALRPIVRYSGQVDTATGYPHGKARNAGAYQDGTGTPLEADLVNDIFGMQQALLTAARITPTGDPDEVGASQYLEAIEHRAMLGGERVILANWTQPTDTAPGTEIAWSPAHGLFIAVGTGGAIKTSPNGRVWTTRTSGVAVGLTSVAASPGGVVVAVGQSGAITRSTNGTTWASQTSGVIAALFDVVWHVDKFVAIDTSGEQPLTSADGITWTAQTASGVGSLASNGVELVMARSDELGWSSPDGVTWTERPIDDLEVIRGFIWSPVLGQFVVVGSGGYVATSPDGVTWTEQTTGSSDDLNDACATDNYLVAVGGNNTILVSRDGVTWATVSHEFTEPGGNSAIAWNGSLCVAVGSDDVVHRSMPRLSI